MVSFISLERQNIIVEALDRGYVFCDDIGNVYKTRNGSGLLKTPSLSGCKDKKGYMNTHILVDGKTYGFKLQHIVWINFNGFIPEEIQINHKNGIKHDNHPDNLELMTQSENMKHAYDTGLQSDKSGERNGRAKLNWEKVRQIRKEYVKGSSGFGTIGLGKKYNVSDNTVWDIISNRRWKEDNQETKIILDKHIKKYSNVWEALVKI